MANRRMFSRSITGSGRFLRLSPQARALYYDLGMEADDDGFAEAYVRMLATGSTEETLMELADKGFITILDWDDLVIHINGWQENNLIRKDRYTPSRYLTQFPQLGAAVTEEPVEKKEPAPPVPQPEETQAESSVEEPEEVTEAPEAIPEAPETRETICQPDGCFLGDSRLTQVSLVKDSLIQVNLAQDRLKTGETCAPARKPIPTDSQLAAHLETEFNKKRQNALDMLLKSKYFGYSRASPVRLPAV